MQTHRTRLKARAVEFLGGACAICGYNNCIGALEFHHINPSQKEFGISVTGMTRSWERIKAEVAKCVLLCANCHREVSAGISQLNIAT